MFREPQKAPGAKQSVPPPKAKSTGRFRIAKLEERIAPFHCGGFSARGRCHACAVSGNPRLCD